MNEIKPRMNFSKVRVRGILKADARALNGGDVLYLIADETGSLPIFLHRAPNKELPKSGSHVVATGRLSVGIGNQIRMRVHDAAQIEVLGKATPTLVCGRVAEVWIPPPNSKAPYRITLILPSGGSLEVVHWFIPKQLVAIGDRLEIKGTLGFHNGTRQFKVQSPNNICHQPKK